MYSSFPVSPGGMDARSEEAGIGFVRSEVLWEGVRGGFGGGQYQELETYELLDESTLLLPRNSEEWQGETAFAEFLRERDVACKFSSYKYVGAETVRSFFDFGGTAEALVKEICQERCTIENVDALWSEYCAQTLDEGAEREKPEPVKKILSNRWSSSAVVTSRSPSATTMAAGSRYCCTSREMTCEVAGAYEPGLSSAQLPPAIAPTRGAKHIWTG